MLFKYFQDRNFGVTVAVNPSNVTQVTEMGHGGSRIYFLDGKNIEVAEPILEVAPRLSEK